MNERRPEEEVIEPEVLPPRPGARDPRASLPPPGMNNRLLLILIGLLLDALDMLTLGPLGLKFGLPAGFITAYVLFSLVRIPLRRRLLYSLAAGLYCMLPGTAVVPLGALLGAWLGFRKQPEKGT